RSTTGPSRRRGGTPAAPTHCAWPRRPSTRAPRWTSTARCAWRRRCSARASPPRTAPSACGRSSSTGPATRPSRSAERRLVDVKRKQVVYHDWEAAHYDDKWSISFDERCIEYAAGRFAKAVGGLRRFDRVLEIGCGTGFFLLNLAQAGVVGEAHCTDIATGMVAVCVENGARLGIPVHGRVADAEALPFPDDSFDLVVGHAIVHHLPDVAGALAEARRVLRPGGRLVIAGEPTRAGDR